MGEVCDPEGKKFGIEIGPPFYGVFGIQSSSLLVVNYVSLLIYPEYKENKDPSHLLLLQKLEDSTRNNPSSLYERLNRAPDTRRSYFSRQTYVRPY